MKKKKQKIKKPFYYKPLDTLNGSIPTAAI